MSARDTDLASDFVKARNSTRDAIDGFDAIAAALDQGLAATECRGCKPIDVVAILFGWVILVAVIYVPALQLAAIAACVFFFGLRSFARLVLGPSPATPAMIAA